MSELNAFGIALAIVETGKYKDNAAVCAVMDTIKVSIQLMDSQAKSSTRIVTDVPFQGYYLGAKGKYRYSTWLNVNDVTSELSKSLDMALCIKEVQAKFDCLIYILKAFGEEIEY